MPWRWLRAAVLGPTLLLFPLHTAHSQSRDHDLLLGLRDTVTAVQSALWEFRRDLSSAGQETILARAGFLRGRCASATGALRRAEAVIDSAAVTPRARRAAPDFIHAMRALGAALDRECRQGFRADGPGVWPDSLRAWGPYIGTRIERAIRSYEAAALRYASAAGFKLEPKLSVSGKPDSPMMTRSPG